MTEITPKAPVNCPFTGAFLCSEKWHIPLVKFVHNIFEINSEFPLRFIFKIKASSAADPMSRQLLPVYQKKSDTNQYRQKFNGLGIEIST